MLLSSTLHRRVHYSKMAETTVRRGEVHLNTTAQVSIRRSAQQKAASSPYLSQRVPPRVAYAPALQGPQVLLVRTRYGDFGKSIEPKQKLASRKDPLGRGNGFTVLSATRAG